MKYFDFYQRNYYFELERRNHLTSTLSIPIGLITVLIGVMSYCIQRFSFDDYPDFHSLLFVFSAIFSACFALLSTYFLFRSYHGYQYRYLSDSDDLLSYQKRLLAYYQGKSHGDSDSQTKLDFEAVLIEKYSGGATYNAKNNDTKSMFLHKCNEALLILLVSVLILSLLYFCNYLSSKKLLNPASSPISNSLANQKKEAFMGDEKDDNKGDEKKPPANPIDTKPEPPADKYIREDANTPSGKK